MIIDCVLANSNAAKDIMVFNLYKYKAFLHLSQLRQTLSENTLISTLCLVGIYVGLLHFPKVPILLDE